MSEAARGVLGHPEARTAPFSAAGDSGEGGGARARTHPDPLAARSLSAAAATAQPAECRARGEPLIIAFILTKPFIQI